MYTTSAARMDFNPDLALERELEREAQRLLSQLLGPKLAMDALDKEELTYLRKFISAENSTLKRQLRAVQTSMSNNQALLADICLLEVKADEKRTPRFTKSTVNALQPVAMPDDFALGSRRFNKAILEGRSRSLQPEALTTPVNAATPLNTHHRTTNATAITNTANGISPIPAPKPPSPLHRQASTTATRTTGLSQTGVPPPKPPKPPKAS